MERRVYLSKRGSEIFSVTREGNRYSEEIRKDFSCSALSVVVIECDGVCCEGRGPLALPLCICVSLCGVARRLVECRTVLLLPSWRVAWASLASRTGNQEAAGATQGSMQYALESVFSVSVRLNFMGKPAFFLPVRYSS